MNRWRLSPPLLCLLPGLALLPVLVVVLQGIHGGGLETWGEFLWAAWHPSGDPLLPIPLEWTAGDRCHSSSGLGFEHLIGLILDPQQ